MPTSGAHSTSCSSGSGATTRGASGRARQGRALAQNRHLHAQAEKLTSRLAGQAPVATSSSTARAVLSADLVVDTSPNTTTTIPQATLSHQPVWLAEAIVVCAAC